jgi:hypothetical protein
MHELISSPGLQFELCELRGSLTYTFNRAGKPAKQYVLSESDFEDITADEDSEDERPQPRKPGLEASAVGIHIRILKNDGQLQFDFEGTNGGQQSGSSIVSVNPLRNLYMLPQALRPLPIQRNVWYAGALLSNLQW